MEGVSILLWAGGLAVVSTVAVILWFRGQRAELKRRRAREAWLHAAEWHTGGTEAAGWGADEGICVGGESFDDRALEVDRTDPVEVIPSEQDLTRAGDVLDVLGSFAAGIASDFGDQLTTIMGQAELMREQVQGHPDLEAGLTDICSAAEAGRRTTLQLMAFGSSGVRRTGYHLLPELVRSVSERAVARCGGEVKQHFSPCARAVEGNLEELSDALEALLFNALEASIEKVVSVRCAACSADNSEDKDGPFIRISVLDDGPGLPVGFERQLFQPGFSTRPGGRGMGLPIAMTMAARNGGRIVLRDGAELSPRQRGTLAELYLRRATPVDQWTKGVKRDSRDDRKASVVLLVEDEESVMRLERRLLEKEGLYVLIASSGEAALEIAQANPGKIDLLVTDISLPGIDGLELAERLARIAPGTPTVFVSGMFQTEDLHSQLLETAPHFIQKPFSTDEFATTVRGALSEVGGKARKRVLVVDDDSTTRRIVRAIVEGNSMDCVVASDGAEALELMGRAFFDLVITDIVMPEMDGIGLCRSIAKRYPGVHVIAMTGNRAGRPGLEAVTSFGAELILSKPFSHDEMTFAINDVLEGRSSGDGSGRRISA